MIIDSDKIYGYFAASYVMRKPSNGWHSFDCPFCGHEESRFKMAVHFEYEYVKCWACGYRKFITQFVQEAEGVSYGEAKDILNGAKPLPLTRELLEDIGIQRISTLELPHGFTPLLSGYGALAERAKSYLTSRGFDVEELDSMGFGYCNEKHEQDEFNFFGYIIIPFKRKGALYYYIGRDFIGNFRKYKNPDKSVVDIGKTEVLFNEDALELSSKELFLTEGWACAMTMGRLEGIASLGWSLSEQQRAKIYRSKAKKLIVLPDVGFYNKAVVMAADFIDHKQVYVVNIDNLEQYGKDPNEIGRERVMEEYKNTSELTMRDVMEIVS